MLDDQIRTTTYELRGAVDLDSARDVERQLLCYAEATEWRGDLVVDCAELTFLDGAGMSAFVRVHLALQELGRRLVVMNLPATWRRELEVAGVLDVIGDRDRGR